MARNEVKIFRQKGRKTWLYRYWDPKTGQRVTKTTKCTDEGKARELAEQVVQTALLRHDTEDAKEIRESLIKIIDSILGITPPSRIKVSDLTETYCNLDEVKGKASVRFMAQHLNQLVRWVESNYPKVLYLDQIDHKLAVEYTDWLYRECTTTKTYQNKRGTIVKAFKMLFYRAGLKENVFAVATSNDKPKTGKKASKTRRDFTQEEELLILDAAKAWKGHGEWYGACLCARFTGMRQADIRNLEWADIDLKEEVMIFDPVKTKRFNVKVLMPLHPELLEYLKDNQQDSGLVFPEINRRMKISRHHSEFTKLLRELGIKTDDEEQITDFHSWRHTFVSRMFECEADPAFVKQLGGWKAESNIMERVYNHFQDKKKLRETIRLQPSYARNAEGKISGIA